MVSIDGQSKNKKMKVALLHLDFANGCRADNIEKLLSAVTQAAEAGATWVVTPELAVEGYFFGVNGTTAEQVPVLPSAEVVGIGRLAAKHGLTVFLGCAERDELTGKLYNSCLVIGSDGQVLGRHRKLRVHGGAEAWSTKGELLEPIACPKMTAGVLVCADSWYVHHAQTLKDKGAEVIIVPAAWPPGKCSPGDCWEQCSAATGLPVWVCNQTGLHPRMDFSKAQSVVDAGGTRLLAYSGPAEAVLLFDWDREAMLPLSEQFRILPLGMAL